MYIRVLASFLLLLLYGCLRNDPPIMHLTLVDVGLPPDAAQLDVSGPG